MARDPAQGVINWFAALMCCVAFVVLTSAGLVLWGLWRLAHVMFGG